MWHVGDPPPHKIPLHHKPTLHMVFVPAKETPSIPRPTHGVLRAFASVAVENDDDNLCRVT